MDRNTDSRPSERAVGLTAEERETLRVALEKGYFEVPRVATLAEVAETLDRSDVEVSAQIRRGIATVLRETDVLNAPAVMADGSTDPNALDRMFDALRHPYRRRILLLVSAHNPRDEDEFSVEDLATDDDDDLKLLTTELYHVHLPQLADAGYVEWDEDAHTIRRGPNFDQIAPLLRLIHDHQDELPDGWP